MSDSRPTHKLTQTASHWGVYYVETNSSGEIINTYPFFADREPSPLIRGLQSLVRSPLRIDQPYVRQGYLRNRGAKGLHPRGAEPFVPVSWDRALGLVADALTRVKTEFGNEAIYGGSYGWASAGRLHHAPSLLKRFLGLNGGYVDKRGNNSFGAAMGIMHHVLGRRDITDMVVTWRAVTENTDLVVMFGGANVKNMQIDSGGAVVHDNFSGFMRARAAGVHFINISPSNRDLPDYAQAEWHTIRPGSDTAMMMAIAHTLVTENLHDLAFLARCCVGYERFERYLLGDSDGQPKSPEWAAPITGIAPQAVRSLARRMASSRTLITASWSIQRADHGEQPVWMTVTLAAMLGQIGRAGRGFAFGFGATNGSLASRAFDIPRPKISLGTNPVKAFCPVGRTNDLLLRPNEILEYNGTQLKLPDIRLVYSAGGNPFHHNANINRLLAAWQRVDTIIVNEIWWNPVARHADIILPGTTTMERNDILAADQQSHWIAMKKVIEPYRQARNDFDIFAELADRLGFGPAYTENRGEMEWLRHMYDEARAVALERGYGPPPFDEFWEVGRYLFPVPSRDEVLLEGFVGNPDARRLKTPSGKIEIFSERVASFGYDDCPGHPAWIEPKEWLGSPLAKRFPFHLLSNQPRQRLHSQLDPAPESRKTKIKDREPIEIGRADAQARGLCEGDIVRVFNDRGATLAGVRIVDGLLPGVLLMATGAWYDPLEPGKQGSLEKHGNPNVLTQDLGTSRLAQSIATQSVLVDLERFEGPLPPVTAFDIPEIVAD
jgi:biotin/methionine sulfoxide reductase